MIGSQIGHKLPHTRKGNVIHRKHHRQHFTIAQLGSLSRLTLSEIGCMDLVPVINEYVDD